MKAPLAIAACLAFAATSYTVSRMATVFHDTAIDKYGTWSFEPDNGPAVSPIAPSWSLFHRSRNLSNCCAGTIHFNGTLPTEVVQNSPDRDLYFYLPAFGSPVRAIQINGIPYTLTVPNLSSVGPLVRIPSASDKFSVAISFNGERTWLMALRKGGGYVGDLATLTSRREFDLAQQTFIPSANALGTLVGGAFFMAIYFRTRRRFSFYALFGSCLWTWSIFYIFLAGHAREIDLFWGSAMHLPARQIAVAGTLALIWSYRLLAGGHLRDQKRFITSCALLATLAFFASLIAGWNTAPTAQVAIFAVSAFLPFAALVGWDRHKERTLTIGDLAYALTWFALAGQVLDVFTVLNGLVWSGIYLPYSNRYTFPLLFSASAIMYLTHFAGFFEKLSLHTRRLKRINRSALTLVGSADDADSLSSFADDLRKAMSVRRCSIARRGSDGNFRVVGVSGVSHDAVGETINLDLNEAIRSSVANKEVTVSSLTTTRRPQFTTGAFVSVPVSIDHEVEYLILLSDPLTAPQFAESDIPYLRQFSLMMSSHQKRLIETRIRIEAESNFKALVETLDPSLYAFVLGKRGNSQAPASHTSYRGIGHFDQVNFVGTLEAIPDTRETELIEIVKRWATPVILKHGGRVRSFGGDAYLFDVSPLDGESEAGIASRLSRILWGLAEGQVTLNSSLLAVGLNPISFRFGGHIGECQDVNLLDLGSNVTTIIGRSVNLTQRIQSVARPGCVLVSSAVAMHLGPEFTLKRAEVEFVKGMGIRNELFRIESLTEEPQIGSAS